MPFQIIRNDITKVKADAIVNTANPLPRIGKGTDSAVYAAAGEKELLREREKIGAIAPGEAVCTDAFALPAKYIIHTVGPAWTDGKHGEFEILRSCYRKSLRLADQLGCKSIAFPLIATGVYGFPKDRALETALSAIREYLEDSELDVTLVVFDRNSYQMASGLTERIEAYIHENYVSAQTEEEYGGPAEALHDSRRRRERRERELCYGNAYPAELSDSAESSLAPMAEPAEWGYEEEPAEAPVQRARAAAPKKKASLEEIVSHLGESFQARLFRMIDERGMSDPEVYKRANVDRKNFSKIRCRKNYTPQKRTIVALAIAMRLNLDDTRDLLASAGMLLTNNDKTDLIVTFCIENGIYDIFEVNALLFRFDEQPLC